MKSTSTVVPFVPKSTRPSGPAKTLWKPIRKHAAMCAMTGVFNVVCTLVGGDPLYDMLIDEIDRELEDEMDFEEFCRLMDEETYPSAYWSEGNIIYAVFG